MKIRRVGAEFHADGQTDMTKLKDAFRNFANAPENLLRLSSWLMTDDDKRKYVHVNQETKQKN